MPTVEAVNNNAEIVLLIGVNLNIVLFINLSFVVGWWFELGCNGFLIFDPDQLNAAVF